MLEITTKLKQRFCKDNNISLQLFKSPYFEDRLKLFGFLDKWNDFVKFVSDNFESVDSYIGYCIKLEDEIVDYIKNSQAAKALNTDDMNKYPHKSIPHRDAYKANCIGKKFISIDMCKANFSTLVFYGKINNLEFFDSYDYKAFIKKFTDFDYFVKSKHMRQVIFGKTGSKRQTTYQSYIMSILLDLILSANIGVTIDHVYGLNSDEILLQIDDDNIINKVIELTTSEKFSQIPLKIETYTIGRLNGTEAFIKLFDDGSYELKCVNPYEAPFIYRYMAGQPYTDNDMYFMFEKRLAKLVEAPTIELIKSQEERE